MTSIINRCESSGLRMTEQRRVIAKVLDVSKDHPDVDIIYSRVSKIDNSISIATVYRTVKQFEEAGILSTELILVMVVLVMKMQNENIMIT